MAKSRPAVQVGSSVSPRKRSPLNTNSPILSNGVEYITLGLLVTVRRSKILHPAILHLQAYSRASSTKLLNHVSSADPRCQNALPPGDFHDVSDIDVRWSC